ncbi:unnamed protein product [Cuscuta epithymum]|uniref:RNase H type-1 domain-containing protein n=1 Tax=Cuscuta epithymum TaxID=186058 RepID=A0AAV0G7W5_9ASTE|nr:unnamed protein product [Cuscuta epithymum]
MLPKWTPPPPGWAKLNTDAGFDVATEEATMGCIIRNCRGEVLVSAWRRLLLCSNAMEAEVIACVEGVRIAKTWINMPLIIEGDCVTIFSNLSSQGWMLPGLVCCCRKSRS